MKTKVTEKDNTTYTITSNTVLTSDFEKFKDSTDSYIANLAKDVTDINNKLAENEKHDEVIDLRLETLRKFILGLVATNIITIIAIIILFIIK